MPKLPAGCAPHLSEIFGRKKFVIFVGFLLQVCTSIDGTKLHSKIIISFPKEGLQKWLDNLFKVDTYRYTQTKWPIMSITTINCMILLFIITKNINYMVKKMIKLVLPS